MIVLFTMLALIIPVSVYRTVFTADASAELSSTVDIIYTVLIGIFLLLTFSFSLFTDDFPRSYNEGKSRILGTVTILLAAALGYTSALSLVSEEYATFDGTLGKVFAIIGMLSVLSFMFYTVTYFKGENIITAASLVPIFPAVWYGFRLLFCFLESASMADISQQLPIIALCCSFTIFSLTLGKLFSCTNSYSIKWAFVTGCTGVLTTFMHIANYLTQNQGDMVEFISHPTIIVDLCMSLFAIGSLFHISKPAKYFDDEQWDDYFYETYDLPKPNLVLHTPVDELEEDSLLDDDIDEAPYIPASVSIGNKPASQQPVMQQPAPNTVPSYIANPAAYAAQPQPTYPVYPAAPPTAYYPAYPPYPTYTYPAAPIPPQGYDYYPQPPVGEYVDPYDAAAQQYQYERRRAELQSRELEKLTGEVDNSLARLSGNVAQSQGASNEFVAASPDERIGVDSPAPTGRNIRLANGYLQPGQRLTDHLAEMEQNARSQNAEVYDEPDEYEDYTYEYYYPTDNRVHYNTDRFDPNRHNNGNPHNGR